MKKRLYERLGDRLGLAVYTTDDTGMYLETGNPAPLGDARFLPAQAGRMYAPLFFGERTGQFVETRLIEKELKIMYDNSILHTKGKAKKEDLDHIEQKFHVKIPAEVREHYLTYNGGYPEKPVFTDKNGQGYLVNWFFPVRCKKGLSIEKSLGLLREDDAIPEWLIPFADEDGGNLFCFSVRESDFGAIYYYDHEFEYGEDPEEHVTCLAESLTAFINSLTEDEDDGDDSEDDEFDEE